MRMTIGGRGFWRWSWGLMHGGGCRGDCGVAVGKLVEGSIALRLRWLRGAGVGGRIGWMRLELGIWGIGIRLDKYQQDVESLILYCSL